jgi:Helix-turn-helix domain
MSWQATSAVSPLQGLTPSEKLLLLTIANYADENGVSWPSQERLAVDTGMTARGVRGILARLEERGLIERQERRRQDGYRASDRIALCLPGLAPPPSPERVSPEPESDLTGTGMLFSPEPASGLTSLEPTNRTTKEPPKARARRAAPVGSKFDEFWLACPRKAGKGAARKAYAKAVNLIGGSDAHFTLMSALARIKPEWAKRSKEHVPHPATWLNEERWEDGETVQDIPAGPMSREQFEAWRRSANG